MLEELPGSEPPRPGLTTARSTNSPPSKRPVASSRTARPAAARLQPHRIASSPGSAVSEGEGTGIVHIAPGCGAEDQELGKENAAVRSLRSTRAALFIDGFGEFTGRNAVEVADDVVADLKAKGLLVAREHYPHGYPHCWRCKTELLFRLVDEWFIGMDWRDRDPGSWSPTVKWIPAGRRSPRAWTGSATWATG